jgi:hypothetical protein
MKGGKGGGGGVVKLQKEKVWYTTRISESTIDCDNENDAVCNFFSGSFDFCDTSQ